MQLIILRDMFKINKIKDTNKIRVLWIKVHKNLEIHFNLIRIDNLLYSTKYIIAFLTKLLYIFNF